MLVTVGLVSAEIIAYVFIVRNFPILSGGRTAAPERQAA
jgi:Ni/Fe-hydrogenase subunit HybB-like protein